MDAPNWPLLALGFGGQALFGLRTVVQWVASERAQRSLVPPSYWLISACAALLLSSYAVLRGDPILLLGPVISLALSLRNLSLQTGTRLRVPPRALVPLVVAVGAALIVGATYQALQKGTGVPALWLAVGVLGQALWTSRFAVQWWASERRGESVLPASFWWFSIGGAMLLASYALSRHDWVFVAAYALNPIPYTRNLILLYRRPHPDAPAAPAPATAAPTGQEAAVA